tara:strand:+ start:319 stop:1071 length:753 start_codon:yes stop_codon:yes gene_type:complete
MASQLPKRDLLSQLADNNTKQIGASDVSDIVATMYQPTLIYHGTLDNDAGRQVIEYYFNPDYFQKKGYWGYTAGYGLTSSTQIYQFTSLGSGIPDGWSNALPVSNDNTNTSGGKGLKIKVLGVNGVVTDYEIVTQGGGYRPDDQLTVQVNTATTNPTITYRGAIRYNSTDVYDMTFNPDNLVHTGINSMAQMTPYSLTSDNDLEDMYCRVGTLNQTGPPDYTDENRLRCRAGYNQSRAQINVTIWRINAT